MLLNAARDGSQRPHAASHSQRIAAVSLRQCPRRQRIVVLLIAPSCLSVSVPLASVSSIPSLSTCYHPLHSPCESFFKDFARFVVNAVQRPTFSFSLTADSCCESFFNTILIVNVLSHSSLFLASLSSKISPSWWFTWFSGPLTASHSQRIAATSLSSTISSGASFICQLSYS
jgi:hypothetical protein